MSGTACNAALDLLPGFFAEFAGPKEIEKLAAVSA
jgi:hypothetical protein